MKRYNKITGIIISLCTAIGVLCAQVFCAGALGVTPVTANESKITVWIFAVLIALAAAAGIIYFIIQHKNKK